MTKPPHQQITISVRPSLDGKQRELQRLTIGSYKQDMADFIAAGGSVTVYGDGSGYENDPKIRTAEIIGTHRDISCSGASL